MKYTAILVFFAAGALATQNLNGLPPCARACLLKAITQNSQCGNNMQCACRGSAGIKVRNGAWPCIEQMCAKDAKMIQASLAKYCS
ncbi:CFEM domain-containing protein [Pochonia chlamydosporia 170]|uniref:CFEM domain-containing protein n=1 Tax=Pochonia chlamydosporia 170 TaxID=1380566 RepID=A0A179G0I1_METCM|nr:CFEM domain-containing protein [Pochonia chlamydosporia 170]OAQ70739.1 CFEM domain-containing protein [Pochonia chlamydosporia 170]